MTVLFWEQTLVNTRPPHTSHPSIHAQAQAAQQCHGATHAARPHTKRLQNFEGKKAPNVDPKILAASTIQRYWRKRFQKNLTYKLIEKYFATGPNIRYVKGIR